MRVIIEGVAGPGKGRSISLRKDQLITIGRTEWSDIAIENDAQISARHLSIENNGKVAFLKDLKSTNGVRINGEEIQEAHLRDGDQIIAGLTTFVVKITDQANQGTPLAHNPYPNAPADPAAQANAAHANSPNANYGAGANIGGAPPSPVTPAVQPSSPIAPVPGSAPAGSPIQSPAGGGAAPANSIPPNVGQSPIGGYDQPPTPGSIPGSPIPGNPPVDNQGPVHGSPSNPAPNPVPATPPPAQGGSPIMYDGGMSAPAPTPGPSSPSDTPTGAAPDQAPIPNSPIAAPPPAPASPANPPPQSQSGPAEAERHIVPSQRQKVKAAGPGALNFERCESKSDRVIYKGIIDKENPDREFHPSALMGLIGGLGPYILITHHQRAGMESPEYSVDSTPLFDWMPPETAKGYSPIATQANSIENPLQEIDDLWDNDAIIVVLVADPQEASKHLVELTKWNPFGVEQGGMFGYCWPKVLAQFIEHADQEKADKTFGNCITGFFHEDTENEKNWQLVADAEFGNKLTQLGFVEIQPEPEPEEQEAAQS